MSIVMTDKAIAHLKERMADEYLEPSLRPAVYLHSYQR